MENKIEKKLRIDIANYEELCNEGRAQTSEAFILFKKMGKLLEKLGYANCAHNSGYYGFKRYKQYMYPGVEKPLTNKEFLELHNELSRD